jgi:hypothetical protein
MDRTVIPNGVQIEDVQARKRFSEFCSSEYVTLVYVTGRHKELVEEAIMEYRLPEPNFAITDVGTKIYIVSNKTWLPMRSWEEEIDKAWNGKNHEQIKQLLTSIKELELQEQSKQNTHKLSYYLPLHLNHSDVMARMEKRLQKEGIDSSLIWSIDEQKNIGLLDLLPLNATKLHAIEFLQHQLKYKHDEVLFAGDSGNDLPVLVSKIHSVLVANASEDIKALAVQKSEENGCTDALYIVKKSRLKMNGNYAAGVLEGVWHFLPAFRNLLEKKEVPNE